MQKLIFQADSAAPLSGTGAHRRSFLAVAGAFAMTGASAQFRIEVSGVGLTQIPIALSTWRGEDALAGRISAIVKADLERSGQFKMIESDATVLDESSAIDVQKWRQRQADALLVGSVNRLPDGRMDVRARLWDLVSGVDRGGQNMLVGPGQLRMAAHKIADDVYQKLTGVRGVFSSRIAYVSRSAGRHQLWVADADGENAQSALSSPEPIISPNWSPSGQQLAYVSFEAKKPVIYAHDLVTGRRRMVASFKGSNSAPAWSPDGKRMAMTLSREGGSQIFVMDMQSMEVRRLTDSNHIETEPVFSADGQQIYFVSDRGGAPQIYRMPVTGGTAQRVTFQSNYSISPATSPDGKWLAYIARVQGQFRLHIQDLATGTVQALTDSKADESPSFAPNSRLIVYATQHEGAEALMTTTIDGRTKTRLAGQRGDIREPDWGPFLASV
jgi:TolB protein